MEKNFVPYNIALVLEELGFDEECLKHYCKHWKDDLPYLRDQSHPSYPEHWQENTTINAPLWQQAFDWFREEFDYNVSIYGRKSMGYDYRINGILINSVRDTIVSNYVWKTYEEARLACLEKLIEIAKE